MTDGAILTANGTVDREGRLIDAEPRLLALQLGAGGKLGGLVAVPQIATLARLAQTLGVLVSRGVFAADGDKDLDLWVRAKPEGDLIQLAVGGWQERKAVSAPIQSVIRESSFAELESEGEWTVDSQLVLIAVSEGFSSLTGADALPEIGASLLQTFRLMETEDGEFPILTATTGRAAFVGQQVEYRKMPSLKLRIHGAPIFDEAGGFRGYRGGLAVIDRPLQSARAIPAVDQQQNTLFAQRLDSALRAPISRIIANADAIHSGKDADVREEYSGYAADISSAGRHLLGLVDDLVDIQAVEGDDFLIETEALDLAEIARRAAGLLRVRAADRDVRIDAPASDEMLMAKGNFRRALQILVNLISNAVRYSPKGSQVWIRTEQEGDLAVIIVADQGKGIAPQDQSRIFEKFERVDPNEPGGNGLGLYIARRLARAMGGDISVDSAPGQGARFMFTLPTAVTLP